MYNFFRMMRRGCLWVHAICRALQVTESCRNKKKTMVDVNESVKANSLHPLQCDFVLTFWRAATVKIVIIGASSFGRTLWFPRISVHLGEQTTSPLSGKQTSQHKKNRELKYTLHESSQSSIRYFLTSLFCPPPPFFSFW